MPEPVPLGTYTGAEVVLVVGYGAGELAGVVAAGVELVDSDDGASVELAGAGEVLKSEGSVTPFALAHDSGSSPSGQQ